MDVCEEIVNHVREVERYLGDEPRWRILWRWRSRRLAILERILDTTLTELRILEARVSEIEQAAPTTVTYDLGKLCLKALKLPHGTASGFLCEGPAGHTGAHTFRIGDAAIDAQWAPEGRRHG